MDSRNSKTRSREDGGGESPDSNRGSKRPREEDIDSNSPNASGEGDVEEQPSRKKPKTRSSSKVHDESEKGESSKKATLKSSKKSKGRKTSPRPNARSSAVREILRQHLIRFNNPEDARPTPAQVRDNGQKTENPMTKGLIIDESEINHDWTEEAPPQNLVLRSQQIEENKEKRDTQEALGHGTDRKPKGEVRPLLNGGGWAFKDVEHPEWTKCEFHYRLRNRFIHEDLVNEAPYDVEPQKGLGSSDVTSRCTNQKHWTLDPATVVDREGRRLLVNGFVRDENTTVRKPSDWVLEDGTVVIDVNGHAVKWFDGIPKALSSNIEPWRVEGLRAFNSMKITDMMARMVKYTQRPDGNLELLQRASAFTNRSRLWRDKNELQSLKKGRPRKSAVDSEDDAENDKKGKKRCRKNKKTNQEENDGQNPTSTPQAVANSQKRGRDEDLEDEDLAVGRAVKKQRASNGGEAGHKGNRSSGRLRLPAVSRNRSNQHGSRHAPSSTAYFPQGNISNADPDALIDPNLLSQDLFQAQGNASGGNNNSLLDTQYLQSSAIAAPLQADTDDANNNPLLDMNATDEEWLHTFLNLPPNTAENTNPIRTANPIDLQQTRPLTYGFSQETAQEGLNNSFSVEPTSYPSPTLHATTEPLYSSVDNMGTGLEAIPALSPGQPSQGQGVGEEDFFQQFINPESYLESDRQLVASSSHENQQQLASAGLGDEALADAAAEEPPF